MKRVMEITDYSGAVFSCSVVSDFCRMFTIPSPFIFRMLRQGDCVKKGRFAGWSFAYVAKSTAPVVEPSRVTYKTQEDWNREFVEQCRKQHGDKFDYSKVVYRGMNKSITVVCPTHGEITPKAVKFVNGACGCYLCNNEGQAERIKKYRHLSAEAKKRNTAKTFFSRCRAVHANKYTYPKQAYPGVRGKLRVECPVHGEFEQGAHKHLTGQGCPTCGAYTPKWEEEVAAIFVKAGLEVERGARILDGREIDIYLPGLKFGIELHGLHWHTEPKVGKTYHREKWESAEQKGIRLVQVFEDEWANKKDIVVDRLLAMVGRCDSIAARKCEVASVPPAQARVFMERRHIQGFIQSSAHYGLYYKGELRAVASFGRARSGAMSGPVGQAWEVLRYASVGRVQGGFSRLLKAFTEEYRPERIVSYCDLRYGDGRLYEACGFFLEGVTNPDYWWVPNGKVLRIPRYQTQKHKLTRHPELEPHYGPNKTEREVCEAAGWSRVFGVGSQRWVKTMSC